MLYSEQPTVLLARRHLNTMLLTSFENLNSILKIFQETHDFLVLMDPITICVYLKTTDRHFRECPSSHLKVTKMWFGPNRKYLPELGCRELIFCYVWFYYHFCNEICTHSIYSIINYWIVISTSAILEKKFMNNLELFQIKNVSGFYPKYCECIPCGVFMSERSKIWKSYDLIFGFALALVVLSITLQ